MKKIENYTNLYSLSKTLRFRLIPVGKTEEYFNSNKLLEEDKERAESYYVVKGYMDRYHRDYIERKLSSFHLDNTVSIMEYYDLFNKNNRTVSDNNQMKKIEINIRSQISKCLKSPENVYKQLNKSDFIKKLLPDYLEKEEEKNILSQFNNFATYFEKFWKNRENMYSADEKSTAIAYRCVNDNLPKFLSNCNSFLKIKECLADQISELEKNFEEIYGIKVSDIFTPNYFENVLAQNSGIDKYNSIIGGYSNSDGTKVQGINEYINLYNQQITKKDRSKRLPKMVQLYKQILSESFSISFIPDKFNSIHEMFDSIVSYYDMLKSEVFDTDSGIVSVFSNLKNDEYDLDGIYYLSGSCLKEMSNSVTNSWNTIYERWADEYKAQHPTNNRTNFEKYEEEMKKSFESCKSFRVSELQKYLYEAQITQLLYNTVADSITIILEKADKVKNVLEKKYSDESEFLKNDNDIELIKEFLDSIKELERIIKPLLGISTEDNRDLDFYEPFLSLFNKISCIDKLYDMVRNYVTQKPFSTDKIKLNFNCSSFFSGWAQKYDSKGTIIIEKDNNYYLAIIDKKFDASVEQMLNNSNSSNTADRIVYDFQKPDNKNTPRLFIRSKGDKYAPAVEKYKLPIEDIIDIYDEGKFRTSYIKKDEKEYKESLSKLIDYFKLGFTRHESYKHYNFCWKNSNEYNDISEFYNDVISSCYTLKKEKIDFDYLLKLVEEGKVYLYQIYNKDFSKYSHGTPNMHTLYFKELFDPENISDIVYQLNGNAEMFYREASIIYDKPTHAANIPIKNKNPNNNKKESVFKYDLIKDKRYTQNQFFLHIPITMNFKSRERLDLNKKVRQSIRNCNENYVIGIDRGERNLIYICVVAPDGKIVEQKSLNEIIYKTEKFENVVDYQKLLDVKEKERDNARKNWKSIENIKELKEGYLSAVVNEICKLVVKYDAIIVMENLNRGFKKGRFKVEKQVYQKFENMLTSKLTYLVDKNIPHTQSGGLLHAYQLTNKPDEKLFTGVQNGYIFYVPAYLTSKIDPITGFINLIYPKYSSVENSKEFFAKFDDIYYDEKENMFAFKFDYSNFDRGVQSFRKEWIVYSNGDRIMTFRNKEKNGEWDNKKVILTEELIRIFNDYKIDFKHNLKQQILEKTEKEFYKGLMDIFKLILQMRNSITGNVDVDYLISPVKNTDGKFYDSRDYIGSNSSLPIDADANGAYNIARKGLWAIEQIKNADEEEYETISISIKENDWLKYAQEEK